jgi:hypothetical protein
VPLLIKKIVHPEQVPHILRSFDAAIKEIRALLRMTMVRRAPKDDQIQNYIWETALDYKIASFDSG